jgi:putative ABC transport system ATP-binding protein
MNNPSILMADEPTGNLDSRTSLEVMDIFQALKEKSGITIVLITHEQSVAEYGSRIVTFKDGHILSDEANDQRRLARYELAETPMVEEQEAV